MNWSSSLKPASLACIRSMSINVLDESYRKAGKMDSECFASTVNARSSSLTSIFPGARIFFARSSLSFQRSMRVELCSFVTAVANGSSTLARRLLVQPTTNCRSVTWHSLAISRLEHEIRTSRHVDILYNLYFDDGGPVSEKDAVSEHLLPLQLPNEEGFHETFKTLLENPEFMAEVGTFAFGLRHVYPVERDLKHVYKVLKGSDAAVYQKHRDGEMGHARDGIQSSKEAFVSYGNEPSLTWAYA
ncbi:hypothetical protein F5888DRAFT_1635470 [Russula emetica]|nr:hypothetical protein F5888DRAFT_1635470 [Russula emetica]